MPAKSASASDLDSLKTSVRRLEAQVEMLASALVLGWMAKVDGDLETALDADAVIFQAEQRLSAQDRRRVVAFAALMRDRYAR